MFKIYDYLLSNSILILHNEYIITSLTSTSIFVFYPPPFFALCIISPYTLYQMFISCDFVLYPPYTLYHIPLHFVSYPPTLCTKCSVVVNLYHIPLHFVSYPPTLCIISPLHFVSYPPTLCIISPYTLYHNPPPPTLCIISPYTLYHIPLRFVLYPPTLCIISPYT